MASMHEIYSSQLTEFIRLDALASDQSAGSFLSCHKGNGGDASGKICRVLAQFDFAKPKTFYDGPVPEFNPKRSISL